MNSRRTTDLLVYAIIAASIFFTLTILVILSKTP